MLIDEFLPTYGAVERHATIRREAERLAAGAIR